MAFKKQCAQKGYYVVLLSSSTFHRALDVNQGKYIISMLNDIFGKNALPCGIFQLAVRDHKSPGL